MGTERRRSGVACWAGALRKGASPAAWSSGVWRRALLTAVVLSLVPAAAMAHELAEEREVLVSVEEGSVDLLVAWTLPAGRDAERVRAQRRMAEWPGMAEEARVSLLGALLWPRMWRGVRVEVGGREAGLALEGIHVRDGSGAEASRGMVAMAVLRVELGEGAEVVRLSLGGDALPLLVMVQVGEGVERGVEVEGTALDGVVAPVRLEAGEAVEVRLGAVGREGEAVEGRE